MLEFTSHPKGIEGVLSGVEREPLCKIDGEVVTIPKQYPAMVGLAYVAIEARNGEGAALVWAMQASLGSENWERLLNAGLLDEQLVQITAIVVARIQGGVAPVPVSEPSAAPKARPRARRSAAARK